MKKVLEIKKIQKYFAGKQVLKGVSIEISQSKIFGLLGPNGAGKTTLLRILTNIIEKDSGEVIVNNEEFKDQFIKKIGYLPEERGLYKKMKVGEHAIYMALLKGMTFKQAKEELQYWFGKLQISEWWDLKVESLSKGMQQKVQFIIAVAHRPELLILDEPFSGLDPVNTEILTKEILELNANGTTIILSTHNMESVETLCGEVALLNNGELILSGKVADIKQRFKNSIIEIGIRNPYNQFISQLNNDFQIIGYKQNDSGYTYSLYAKNANEVKAILEKNLLNIDLFSYQEPLPTMNEIFIKLVKNGE